MATYGDGEPTDNASEFYKWMTKSAQAIDDMEKEAWLGHVTYAVFGLGNKQYEHFNAIGKKVFKCMGTLGAAPLIRRGDGDDDGCIDEEFEKWCSELNEALDSRPDLVGSVSTQATDDSPDGVAAYVAEVKPVPRSSISISPGSKKPPTGAAAAFPAGGSGLMDAHHPYVAQVALVRELHGEGSDRSCVHAEIDISGSKMTYEHGDHVAVFAQNSDAVVDELASLLGHASADSVTVTLSKPSKSSAASSGLASPPFSGPLPLRLALACFADVLSSPHKDSLRALAAFAPDPSEGQKLRRMAMPEGKDEYAAYISKPHRSLLEVLRDHPAVARQLPLGAFFASVAPRLQPRFYSISSSPAMHPGRVHVTAAVVRDVMPTGRVHEGVASTWLKRCGGGPKATPTPVPVFVRRSHFKLPKDASTPIVMVGPGTGLAPFRGFLQERQCLQKSGSKLGPALLFFGCRNRAHDYIYRSELEEWLAGGVLSTLDVAFSREGAAKDYVQHHLEKKGEQVGPRSPSGHHGFVIVPNRN